MALSILKRVAQDVPLLGMSDLVGGAAEQIVKSGLPALPVIDAEQRLCGIFGEREFMEALFPGYFRELRYAGFVRRSLDQGLEKRADCLQDEVWRHLNREHVHVFENFSDTQVAETFLHHRVLIVPVVDAEVRVVAVVTRADFFAALVDRLKNANS